MNEIVDFTQQDLVTDDVFILDTYNNVYVWVGEDARPEEKTMAMDAAIVSELKGKGEDGGGRGDGKEGMEVGWNGGRRGTGG